MYVDITAVFTTATLVGTILMWAGVAIASRLAPPRPRLEKEPSGKEDS